jgi:DNA-binding NarL/FixJ family response regulator
MAKIVLAGFDPESSTKLARKLVGLQHQTDCFPGDSAYLAARQADLVFLSGDDVRCKRNLAAFRSKAPNTPVIVASRAVEDSHWLTALEAGATDYCSLDVDPANLDWMLKNALECKVFAGAA